MRVLLINGSPRKRGNTFLALSEAAKTLEQQGIETEIVQIGVKPVRGCIACGQCKAKQLGRCVFDDDICNRISEKLDDVDALIVGSPVYYGQPNGSVLALVQRMFFSAGAKVVNKPVPSRRSYCSLSDHEHALPDDEHACGDIPILEHCLWP